MIKIERLIVTSRPIAFLIRKSKQIVIPGFQGLPLFDVVRVFFLQINKIGLNERAAAISFNIIMAIPAACIFLFSVVPYLPVSAQFRIELLALTKDLTPNKKTYDLMESFLNDFFKKSKGGFLVSFLCFSFSGGAISGRASLGSCVSDTGTDFTLSLVVLSLGNWHNIHPEDRQIRFLAL